MNRQLHSVKHSFPSLLQWTQFIPTLNCRKTKMSSKERVQFLDYSFMSDLLSDSLRGFKWISGVWYWEPQGTKESEKPEIHEASPGVFSGICLKLYKMTYLRIRIVLCAN